MELVYLSKTIVESLGMSTHEVKTMLDLGSAASPFPQDPEVTS